MTEQHYRDIMSLLQSLRGEFIEMKKELIKLQDFKAYLDLKYESTYTAPDWGDEEDVEKSFVSITKSRNTQGYTAYRLSMEYPEHVSYYIRKNSKKRSDDCVDWTGPIKIEAGGKKRNYARIFSYFSSLDRLLYCLEHRQELPDGSKIVKACGNNQCANPKHLVESAYYNPKEEKPKFSTRPRSGTKSVLEEYPEPS